MRVALLVGNQPNQIALANRIAKRFEVVGVVLSANVPRKGFRRPVRRFVNRVSGRVAGRPFLRAWESLQDRYRAAFPAPPRVPVVEVRNVNDAPAAAALREWKPSLVAVSGTNLVGRTLIREAEALGGIANLHTGISPFVNGGPNCTNWCLAEGAFHLIGSTVLWLDAGIDSGPILATERAPLEGGESLEELHWKVMEHAHDLYGRALATLDRKRRPPGIPQASVGTGRTYHSHEWGARAMRRAIRNHAERFTRERLASAEFRALADAVRLFPAPGAG